MNKENKNLSSENINPTEEKIEKRMDKRKNRKKKKKDKRKKGKAKKIFKRIMIGFGSLMLVGVISVGGLAGYIYMQSREDISRVISSGYEKVKNINNNTFNNRYETKLLDKDGNVIKEFKVANYDYQTYDEIDKRVFMATMAIEDERFYNHNGIDYIGLLRAGTKTVLSKGKTVQGGSTITQQLVKNVFLTMDKTVWRKLEEMVIAQELEKKYSKEEILEFYVNNINFGHGCYGIETASEYFFQKETEELTLAEIALLVGVPNNPTLFDPINNFENADKRKRIILNKMRELELISDAELNEALNQKIEFNIKKTYFDNNVTGYDNDFAMQKATEAFMKSNGFQFRYNFKDSEERKTYFEQYEEAFNKAREELISGGYIIQTSIDKEKQDMLQQIVDNELKGFTKKQENGLYMRQASATVIDNETGEVVAIVGGRSQDGNTFNRASLGARQPGSALKPIVSYAPAFEKGYSPDNVMEDRAISKGPLNWYSGYKGNITLRYATEISNNTIPYRLTSEVGVENALNKLYNMNFKYLTAEDSTPIIALGGLTRGVTTVELASAYSTLARGGEFIEPTNVKKITKVGTEDVVYENVHSKRRIYDEGASYLMTDTLKGVISEPHGTGKKAGIDGFKNQVAKTGTTDSDKDVWLTGYTPYYSMAVWVGDDTPARISSAGYDAPKYIWKKAMTKLHKGLEDIDFVRPKTVYVENGKLKAKSSKENELLKERKVKEQKRRDTEIANQNERLNEFEYRIKYGLSEEEETAREYKADGSIRVLENYKYTSLSQEADVRNLIRQAKQSVEDVKKKSAYNELYNRLTKAVSKLESKDYQLKESKRRKEEEIRRQEEKIREEELKRQEEEKRKQEEEEKKKQEEQNNSNNVGNIENVEQNTQVPPQDINQSPTE